MRNTSGFRFRGIYVVIALLLLLIVFSNNIANFIINYQWFSELKYEEVFFKKLVTQLKFFIPSFVLLFVVFFTFLRSINAHSIKYSNVALTGKDRRVRNIFFALISLIVSFLFSLSFVSSIWYDFLIYMNKTPFNIADPVFSKDIGFYIFTLPFVNKLYGFLIGFIVVLALLTVGYNLLVSLTAKTSAAENGLNVTSIYDYGTIYKKILRAASKQLFILGGLFFLLLAFGFYLKIFDLVYSPRGVAYGASHTDINVTLPSYYIYIGICILTSILMFISSGGKRVRLAVFGPLLLIVCFVVSGIASTVVQNIIVTPNEISKEEKYLQNNINYTNYAYGLDKVVVKPFAVKQDLARENIENNRVTINNIPINDYRPTKDIYNQIQGLKTYYQFNDIDIDRYTINGTYRQVFISPRELQSTNIPKQTGAQGASWINKYLKYTHGYGVALSPVNEVTPSGQPRLFIKDMPVTSDIDIRIDRPQIYFGELTDDFVVVNTKEKEFDYPSSNANVETVYEGTGGIKLNGLNRILFAITQGNMNFLLSQDISSESKVLMNREITDRAKKIAPFLVFDEDPYVVIADGKLYWILDAYTISNRYPYSEPINNRTTTNYIRNSVKVIIDAYDGTTDFYISDKNDPIISAYANVFKTLFKPLDKMPNSLRAHIRYPQMLFDIQAEIYRKYHMKTAREFYNKSDIWDIATQIYGSTGEETQSQTVESAYLVMRLPDSEKEEFLLMNPYTSQGKTNMIAWLGVKNDGDSYGQLILYNFPSGKIVEGPMQVEGIVSQDTVIGPQLNLLATGGNSQVVRGNMLIIPVEESILYVEPIYVRAVNANALPELKKVIVFYKNQVVMEDTLEKSLARIFPTTAMQPEVKPQPEQPIDITTQNIEDLIKQANKLFKEAQDAQKAGNWADYGSRLKDLEDVLNKLGTLSNQTTKVPEQTQVTQ